MSDGWKPAWRSPGEQFSHTLRILVDHRGLATEGELVDLLGRDRLLALYKGAEPRLGEFIEIARILDVPLSTFQVVEPGAFPELEIAFAEILYHAAGMSPEDRSGLAEKISALALTKEAPEDNSVLPDTLLAALRRGGE